MPNFDLKVSVYVDTKDVDLICNLVFTYDLEAEFEADFSLEAVHSLVSEDTAKLGIKNYTVKKVTVERVL